MDAATGDASAHADTFNISKINLRVLRACSAFASKELERYYINGVCLEIEARSVTYIATDGHRLIACRHDATPDEPANLLIGTFIIPTAHCNSFKIGKEDDGVGKIFGHGRLTISHELVDLTFVPIDGTYPDWRKVFPRDPVSGGSGQYNLDLLRSFKKFADDLSMAQPFIAMNGVKAPSIVQFSGSPHVLGVIMPMLVAGEIGREVPAWARGPAPHAEQADIEDAA